MVPDTGHSIDTLYGFSFIRSVLSRCAHTAGKRRKTTLYMGEKLHAGKFTSTFGTGRGAQRRGPFGSRRRIHRQPCYGCTGGFHSDARTHRFTVTRGFHSGTHCHTGAHRAGTAAYAGTDADTGAHHSGPHTHALPYGDGAHRTGTHAVTHPVTDGNRTSRNHSGSPYGQCD